MGMSPPGSNNITVHNGTNCGCSSKMLRERILVSLSKSACSTHLLKLLQSGNIVYMVVQDAQVTTVDVGQTDMPQIGGLLIGE